MRFLSVRDVFVLCSLTALAHCAPLSPILDRPNTFHKGVALGLFISDDPRFTDEARLEEIHALHATDVSFVLTWVQDDLHANEVHEDPAYSLPLARVTALIRRAHALGLRVTLFPVVRLVHRTASEWRGLIKPTSLDRWFTSYGERLSQLAELAQREKVEVLCVGSELVSLERQVEHWRQLIAEARVRYSGRLLYSANWDRYTNVTFWDALDFIGVSAYWEMSDPGRRPTLKEAMRAWQPVRDQLVRFQQQVGRPLLFTEIGYPSVHGGGAQPWNDFLSDGDGASDGEAQRRLYEAFATVWSKVPALGGVYVWLWFAKGGFGDRSYAPRGKPAELVLRSWYRPPLLLPPLR